MLARGQQTRKRMQRQALRANAIAAHRASLCPVAEVADTQQEERNHMAMKKTTVWGVVFAALLAAGAAVVRALGG